MTVTMDSWVGPGSGASTSVAPNTFWSLSGSTGQTWAMQAQFFNASGGLVTVNATLRLWDVTSGVTVFSSSGVGVNTLTLSANQANGHINTYAVDYQGGTSCDHCIISTTNNPIASTGHIIFLLRRSGVWSAVWGDLIRIRRNGVWAVVNGGIFVRRSGAWSKP